MQLENYAVEGGPPSPVIHLAVQSQLGRIISRAPVTIGGTLDDTQAYSIKADIDKWFGALPPAYQEIDTNTQWDEEHLYIPLQRRQLHAIGYMTMLLPFKMSLVKTVLPNSSNEERARRETAVDIALHLMEVSRQLFDYVYPVNAKFHLVTFLIFDTAAFLCSALIHDKDRSLPRRGEINQAILLACGLLEKLAGVTKTGAICYPVLGQLVRSLSTPAKESALAAGLNSKNSPPKQGDFERAPDPVFPPLADTISPDSLLSLDSTMAPEMFFTASSDHPITSMETPPIMGVGDLSNEDVGQFDQIWDWQNLNLTLLPSLTDTYDYSEMGQ